MATYGVQPAVFPGTTAEGNALLEALARNCQCVIDQATGRRAGNACSAHGLLLDERVLGHLLFMRRIRERLVAEEAREDPDITPPEGPTV